MGTAGPGHRPDELVRLPDPPGEGRKTLWIKAIDVAGNLTTAVSAVAGRSTSAWISIRRRSPPPTPSATSSRRLRAGRHISDSNPASIAGTTLNLAVTVDGGSSTPIASWIGLVDLPLHGRRRHPRAGWDHTFVFTGTDVAAKTTTLTRTDRPSIRRGPSTTITNPGNYTASQASYWISGATATFGGSAFDLGTGASGVAAVYYKIDTKGVNHAADPNPAGTWSLATGSTTWSGTANLTAWARGSSRSGWPATTTRATSRQYEPRFRRRSVTADADGDASGRRLGGGLCSLSGTIRRSNALSSLTVTEIAATTSVNAGSFILGKDYTISIVGTTDFVSIGASSNTVGVQFTASGAGTGTGVASLTTSTNVPLTTPATVGGTSQTWSTGNLPLGGIVSGSFTYVVTVTDVAQKPTTLTRKVAIDTTPPTAALTTPPAWISSTAYTISGSATDPGAGASGIATIQYQLDGGAFVAANWYDTSGGGNTLGRNTNRHGEKHPG